MSNAIKNIFLTKDFHFQVNEKNDETNTDVIVCLDNGEKYVASFSSFIKIQNQRLEHKQKGDFLDGKYFWEKNMLLIDDCSEASVKEVINHLIAEGEFMNVFERI